MASQINIPEFIIDWCAAKTKRIGWSFSDADEMDIYELTMLSYFYDDFINAEKKEN